MSEKPNEPKEGLSTKVIEELSMEFAKATVLVYISNSSANYAEIAAKFFEALDNFRAELNAQNEDRK